MAARTAALLVRLRTSASPEPTISEPTTGSDTGDLNRICLSGTLGCEPLLYDVGDHPVAALALACQRRQRTSSGAIQLVTTWFNLSAWEELAEQCGREFHRGDRVYVEGSLRLWTELRGPHSYGCHVVALDRIVLLAAGGGAAEPGDGRP